MVVVMDFSGGVTTCGCGTTELSKAFCDKLQQVMANAQHDSGCPVAHEASVDCVWPIAVCVPRQLASEICEICWPRST